MKTVEEKHWLLFAVNLQESHNAGSHLFFPAAEPWYLPPRASDLQRLPRGAIGQRTAHDEAIAAMIGKTIQRLCEDARYVALMQAILVRYGLAAAPAGTPRSAQFALLKTARIVVTALVEQELARKALRDLAARL